MKKQTRSILQELNTLSITNDKDRLIESTASNIINSSINLINLINKMPKKMGLSRKKFSVVAKRC